MRKFLISTGAKKKKEGPLSKNRCLNSQPTAIEKKKKNALVQKIEMLSTMHQRVQIDRSYNYPAARVSS